MISARFTHDGGHFSRRYDFSHLGAAELDEELAALNVNFEKDVTTLRRRYEKRGRALRAARMQLAGGAPAPAPDAVPLG